MFDNREIAEWIMKDGLGETIENGISAVSIEDHHLAKLWKECEDKMYQIYLYLERRLEGY